MRRAAPVGGGSIPRSRSGGRSESGSSRLGDRTMNSASRRSAMRCSRSAARACCAARRSVSRALRRRSCSISSRCPRLTPVRSTTRPSSLPGASTPASVLARLFGAGGLGLHEAGMDDAEGAAEVPDPLLAFGDDLFGRGETLFEDRDLEPQLPCIGRTRIRPALRRVFGCRLKRVDRRDLLPVHSRPSTWGSRD